MLEQVLSDLRQLDGIFAQLLTYARLVSQSLIVFIPVGLIGGWRWAVWLMRNLIGSYYHSVDPTGSPLSLSIVTPVYNEDPQLFRTALDSWAANLPQQLIAVIDYTDTDCIAVFHEFVSQHHNRDIDFQLVVTQKPGKRAALADGILASTMDIVALVDSDTIWADDIRELILPPFADGAVGGVGTRQNVLKPQTLSQRLFDVYLDLRYLDEIRFLAAAGDALTCLSGRTAVYRRSAVTPLVDELVNETFLGKPVISGDDKCLTHLVQRDGWKVCYQSNARVYTPGAERIRVFLRQRLRWSRNSWRADLRALSGKWLWKRRALAFQLLDRLVQPVTTLIAPTYFILSLFYQQWLTTIILLVWWFISRTLKIWPHLKRRRSNIIILPAYIFTSYWFAVMRIYAFFTMNEQGWITRWDKSRFNRQTLVEMVPGYIGTGLIILLVASFINLVYSRQLILASMLHPNVYMAENEVPNIDQITIELSDFPTAPKFENFGATSTLSNDGAQHVALYRLSEGDTEVRLTRKYGVERSALSLKQDPPQQNDTDAIGNTGTERTVDNETSSIFRRSQPQPQSGQVYAKWRAGNLVEISMPFKDPQTYRQLLDRALPIREASDAKEYRIEYRPESDTIVVKGKLYIATIADIHRELANNDLIEHEGDGVYLLKANLSISPHTILLLERKDVTWLKLQSDIYKSVHIIGNSSNIFIDGTTISSWDPFNQDYDQDPQDGRSYIRVDNGRMDIINAEISHLGQPHTRTSGGGVYGLSWRVDTERLPGEQIVTGMIEHSFIHDNYIGLYASGAAGMRIRYNDFSNNLRNGIEIKQASSLLNIEDNYVSGNARHGVTLSRHSVNNTVRNNRIVNNGNFGIVLDRGSNFNSIEQNTLSGNLDALGVWQSEHNLINDNQISNNQRGIQLNQKAAHNLITSNELSANAEYGIYLNDGAHHNEVWLNQLEEHTKGIFLRASDNLVRSNNITQSDQGLYLNEEASNNLVTENILFANRIGLYLKTAPDDYILGNEFPTKHGNDSNIRITDVWSPEASDE